MWSFSSLLCQSFCSVPSPYFSHAHTGIHNESLIDSPAWPSFDIWSVCLNQGHEVKCQSPGKTGNQSFFLFMHIQAILADTALGFPKHSLFLLSSIGVKYSILISLYQNALRKCINSSTQYFPTVKHYCPTQSLWVVHYKVLCSSWPPKADLIPAHRSSPATFELHHPDPKLLKSWKGAEMDGDSGRGSLGP